MNLKDNHIENKPLQTKKIFTAVEGVISIQLIAGGKLKEHITLVPAMLIAVSGEVVFENEKGVKEILLPGDYISIEAKVKHWVTASKDSSLLLIK
jgi:quercetin dioxygenase-like cupin family protein